MINDYGIVGLRTEGEAYPIGMDKPQPVFSYRIDTVCQNWNQKSRQLLVYDTEEDQLVWDSGIFTVQNTNGIRYEGSSLHSNHHYCWKVLVCSHDGQVRESEKAHFHTGLLHQSDWQAKWICGDAQAGTKALSIFRKELYFEKPVHHAYAYICGLGQYELYLNGNKVGTDVLKPGWTNYRKACFYNTYDLTEWCDDLKGAAVLGVELGNGMYHVDGSRYAKFRDSMGNPKLILQIEVEYEDGTRERIVSDETMRTAPGPIVFSCIYGGEDYDATKEEDGWMLPGFRESENWKNVVVTQPPAENVRLCAQMNPPIKVKEVFSAAGVRKLENGKGYVIDFGQNFSGWFSMKVRGKTGQKLRLIPSELLTADGEADQEMIGAPVYYEYTCGTKAEAEWSPRFTYYGFRYLQVTGAEVDLEGEEKETCLPVILDIKGLMIYSDVEIAGEFSCSNEMFNQIHHMITYSMKSNMQSVFTDCPHREKLGWLEQIHLIGPGLLYNFACKKLYEKVLHDMEESQTEEGLVPSIAPEYVRFEAGFRDSPEWGGACILVSWYLYCRDGEIQVLKDSYAVMQRYLRYLESKADRFILHHGLGDWLDVGVMRPFSQNTPVPVVATSMFYYLAKTMEQIASALGREEDGKGYGVLSAAIKDAFHREFYDSMCGRIANGSQAANAMALYMGLLEPGEENKVLDYLVRDIQMRSYHTTAGDVGHPYVVGTLIKYDKNDIMHQMMLQTDYPSYGAQALLGATTMGEDWAGADPGHPAISQNHFMLGAAEQWFYEGLAGIRYGQDGRNAEKLWIKPYFPEDMNWLQVSHQTICGKVQVFWERKESTVELQIVIPPNMAARIMLPGQGDWEDYGSGKWSFQVSS